jgi:hypothetical protein
MVEIKSSRRPRHTKGCSAKVVVVVVVVVVVEKIRENGVLQMCVHWQEVSIVERRGAKQREIPMIFLPNNKNEHGYSGSRAYGHNIFFFQ